jgi:hypothetical protein
MNRTIVLTCVSLVAVVCFALSGDDQEASAGLFGNRCGGRARAKCCEPAPAPEKCDCGGRQGLFARLKARRCKKAECSAPAPTCHAEASACAEAPACEPACGEASGCTSGCESAAMTGCDSGCASSTDSGCTSGCGAEAAASDCGCSGGEAVMESAPAMPEEVAPEAPAIESST